MKRFIRRSLLLLCAVTGVVNLPAHAMEKSPDEWISESNQTLRADPWDAKAYYNRGTGHYGKGDYEAAVTDLSASITLEPAAPDAYFNRGLSYRRQHQLDEAISDFTEAIRLSSDQPQYHSQRGAARFLKEDFDGAVSDLSEAIRLSPWEVEPYFFRGLAFMMKGDPNEAFADSVRALQIDPDHANAWRLLRETLAARESKQSTAAPMAVSGFAPILGGPRVDYDASTYKSVQIKYVDKSGE